MRLRTCALATWKALGRAKPSRWKPLVKPNACIAADSNVEGLTEVSLRRGAVQDAFGEYKEARADLERALKLADRAEASYQQCRCAWH
jgi:hypothetical protein